MIMPWLRQITDLEPLILGNIIDLTLLGRLIWILGSNSVNEILGLVIKLSVQVRQLMTSSRVDHVGSFDDLVFLLVDLETFI